VADLPGTLLTDYGAIFRAMPTPYLVMTPDLVIADANPAYLETTGRTLEEIVGRPVFDAFPGNPNENDPDGGATTPGLSSSGLSCCGLSSCGRCPPTGRRPGTPARR
jgi:hypothetical protein